MARLWRRGNPVLAPCLCRGSIARRIPIDCEVENVQVPDADIVRMRDRLLETALSVDSWVLNDYEDGRHCLVWDRDRWIAGFFERGRFDERFSEKEPDIALTKFIEWVASSEASTRAGAEATARWLKRTGQSRP